MAQGQNGYGSNFSPSQQTDPSKYCWDIQVYIQEYKAKSICESVINFI